MAVATCASVRYFGRGQEGARTKPRSPDAFPLVGISRPTKYYPATAQSIRLAKTSRNDES